MRNEEYAQELDRYLRLRSYPIAVKMLQSEDEISENTKRPKRDFGHCLSTCQGFSISRREGISLAMLKEDMWCFEPVIGYGIEEPPDYFLQGHNRFPADVENLEASSNWAQDFPRFEPGKYIGIMFAPLSSADFNPDLVMVYCDPAQLTLLLYGSAYKDGSDITSRLSGHAACVYSVVPLMQTGKSQVAVPCMGDRTRAMAQDFEMIFSLPRGKMEDLIEGLGHISERDRSIPFGFTLQPEYELEESYFKIAKKLDMEQVDKKANK